VPWTILAGYALAHNALLDDFNQWHSNAQVDTSAKIPKVNDFQIYSRDPTQMSGLKNEGGSVTFSTVMPKNQDHFSTISGLKQ